LILQSDTMEYSGKQRNRDIVAAPVLRLRADGRM
jgi:hypothetical protein